MIERRPRLWKPNDGRFGSVDFARKGCSGGYAALCVPARDRFCFLESFFEIFKLAGHGRLPRGCDDAPPTMESSRRGRRQRYRAVRESRQTRPLRRRCRFRLRGFESARQRARPALRQKVEAPQPRAAWHPYRNSSTSRISRQYRMIALLCCELQDRGGVVGLPIAVVREDLVARRPSGEQIEDIAHRFHCIAAHPQRQQYGFRPSRLRLA